MSEFLFPDTTVLCNFASVDRLDLLASVLNGRGRWTDAVAFEVGRSGRVWPALSSVAKQGWLGDPVEITTDKEVQAIERTRRVVFGGNDDEPLRHLGEAQTCFVISQCPEFAGAWWISDDHEAVRYARFQGITTRESIDLMSAAVVDGDIAAKPAFELMYKMADLGRSLRLPASHADLHR